MRRRTLLAATTGLAASTLIGCARPNSPEPTASARTGAFPARIPHVFGETMIESAPSRVYSLGYTDHDALFALGVLPVAITQWFTSFTVGPWTTTARAALAGPDPEILRGADGTNLEAVAKAVPELITSYYSGLESAEYENLSKIAPVITRPPGSKPWSSEWARQVTDLGIALGRQEQADSLVADLHRSFAETRAAHPEFAGRTLALALPGEGGQLYAYTTLDPRYRVLQELGFILPRGIAGHPDARKAFYVTLSAEETPLMDADAVGVIASAEQQRRLDRDTVWQQLPAVRDGRSFTLDVDDVGAALSFSTILSVPYALGQLVRTLADLPRP